MAGRTFGGPYTRTIRRQDSSVFYKSLPPLPTQPRSEFLKAADRRPLSKQDGSSFVRTATAGVEPTTIKRWFDSGDRNRRIYSTAISLIRGNAGPAGAAPAVSPPFQFLTTDPRIRSIAQPNASTILPPIFEQYDADAGGAFINTPTPWRSQVTPYRPESLWFQPPIILPPIQMEIRAFINQPHSYTRPWRREGSQTTSPQIASVFFSYEIQRFFNPVPPTKAYGASYRDVSGSGNFFGIFGPPNFIPQPSTTGLYDIYHYYANHS